MSNDSTATETATTTSIVSTEVHIWVDGDEDANRVSSVLEALGYTVLRELEEGDGPARLRWAITRLARRHKLTLREQDILERVLAGRNNQEIGRDLEISRATVKWHMHNIFAKTNTTQRESLLRLALQLGGARSPVERVVERPIELPVEEPVEEDTPVVREAELATEPHVAVHEVIPAEVVPSKAWF